MFAARLRFLLYLGLFGAVFIATADSPAGERRPAVAAAVDLARYAGTWYEIARLPNHFQKDCACCATATYTLTADGKIEITDRCLKADGTWKISKAEAVAPGRNKARWRATFFKVLGLSVGKGRYWILGLDADYRWAVVGDPQRKFGWILSRTPVLGSETRAFVDELLVDRGYDPEEFVDTPQQEVR